MQQQNLRHRLRADLLFAHQKIQHILNAYVGQVHLTGDIQRWPDQDSPNFSSQIHKEMQEQSDLDAAAWPS
jgi:hypothetical protein